MSHCSTPATMQKQSVFPSVERTFTFVFYTASLWLLLFLWGDRRLELFALSFLSLWNQMPIFPLSMESNALDKFTNNRVSSDFFARTLSNIRRIVKICDVDQFLRKPFWFFRRTFSISSSMLCYIVNLIRNGSKGFSSVVLTIPRSPFLGKGRIYMYIYIY